MNSLLFLIVAALGVSYALPTTSDCDYKWISQPIDHYGKSNGTFLQRYSIVDDFYKPGGPIMFFQGEETWALDCVNTTIMYDYARQLGGLAVSLEHRYFGQSLPFGENSHTASAMQYLTLDNVMADAVSFIEFVKKTNPGASQSKAIVASGSYGGFLAGAFRLNHPDAFFASLASAGPVKAFSNSSNPETYNWWKWVNRVYLDRSKEAADKIENAFKVLQSRLASPDIASLKEELNLCSTPSVNDTLGNSLLISTLVEPFSFAAELNYPILQLGRNPIPYPLDQFINATLEEQDPIQVLNRTFWLWFGAPGPSNAPCMNYTSIEFLQNAVPGIENAPFEYIDCTYLPVASNNIPEGTIFPAAPYSSDAVPKGCQQKYGVTTMTQEEIFQRYNLSPDKIRNSTRIIWSNAEYDPTSAVSVDYLPPSADPCASRMILTSNIAHREDLFVPSPTDSETLTQLRNKEVQIFKEWLALC
ncbi:peptidase S28 [Hypoxylon trugodes]|uniref:peptidase S28 n=1 Tax=Hypoxylon trugodes TaxID=326681 RepID=UPI00219C38B0|nr:peptidase S28 [Hypoxylon trugodes]KAI1382985.1 peptidase S28 [Hypoxylon trugodes]